MNRRKNLFAVVSALVASTTLGHADLYMSFTTNRIYRQAPDAVNYREGSFRIRLFDGNWTYDAGCPLNGSAAYYPPSNPLPPCPLGATGYLVGGDADNDGNRDDFTYWSVIDVVPAFYIAPNRADLCSLYSAPPSELPRPIGAFTDMTDTMYFDIQTEAVTEYRLTDYFYERPYTTRGEMDAQVVTGTYRFSYPRLGDPETKVVIPVEYYPIPEGRLKRNNVWQGHHFKKLNGQGLVWQGGFVRMDPRLPNTFEWEGNSYDNIFPGTDQMFLSMSRLAAAPAGDPTRPIDATAQTYYPGFVAPGTSRVLLQNPLVTSAVIPPGMIPIVGPVGTPPTGEGMLRLALVRNMPSGGISYDTSLRTYELPITFVNTYEGWAAVRFPAGTAAALRAPTADPDKDGFINSREWTANTNPMNAAAPWPPAPALAFVQGRSLRSTDSAASGYWETKHQKTVNAWPPIQYQYEFSTDLQNWSVVGPDNPDWAVIETEEDIQIRSRHETLTGKGFLRLKETTLPEPAPEVVE